MLRLIDPKNVQVNKRHTSRENKGRKTRKKNQYKISEKFK
jgi:hypothetical protein